MPHIHTPTHEEIALRSYQLWQARGGAHGSHHDDWLEAERQLRDEAVRFKVTLANAGANKITVVKELRDLTGISLAEARDLTEQAPSTVKALATAAEAEAIRARLTEVGATVEVS